MPLHLRNPVTPLMKNMGYGQDYKYAHDYPEHFVEQQYLPDSLKDKKFYKPGILGYEKEVITRLKSWWQKNNKPKATEGQTEPAQENPKPRKQTGKGQSTPSN